MSKTDKTRPYWVQIREKDPRALNAYHRHYGKQWEENGCDIGYPQPLHNRKSSTRSCEWWFYRKDQAKIWGRRPSRATRKALGFEGRNRALLRKLRYEWLHETDRDSIDSFYGAPKRHCQVRDPWDWD